MLHYSIEALFGFLTKCFIIQFLTSFLPVHGKAQMFCGMRSSHKFYTTLAAAAFAKALPLTCTDCVCLCTWRLLLYLLQPAASSISTLAALLARLPGCFPGFFPVFSSV